MDVLLSGRHVLAWASLRIEPPPVADACHYDVYPSEALRSAQGDNTSVFHPTRAGVTFIREYGDETEAGETYTLRRTRD